MIIVVNRREIYSDLDEIITSVCLLLRFLILNAFQFAQKFNI